MQISQVPNFYRFNQQNKKVKESTVSFGAIIHPQCYNRTYTSFGYNGAENDKFIEKNIKNYFPDAKNTRVLDIGAGDGRNSLPLSKLGYKVTACELSDSGRKLMQNKKNQEYIDNLKIVKHDILDTDPKTVLKDKNFFDFAFMAHVSQHFNEKEMVCAAKNVYQQLKKNGIFLFDALIVNGESQQNCKFSDFDMKSGQYGFKENSISRILQKVGFKLISSTDYAETGKSRPSYIDCAGWGGKTFYGVPRKPVTLKWLVWKK